MKNRFQAGLIPVLTILYSIHLYNSRNEQEEEVRKEELKDQKLFAIREEKKRQEVLSQLISKDNSLPDIEETENLLEKLEEYQSCVGYINSKNYVGQCLDQARI